MVGTLEIFDLDERGSAIIGLPEILEALEPEGQHLVWSMLDLEGTADPSRLGMNMLDLEQQVAKSPNGLILEWKDLKQLAKRLDQIIEGTIVGCRNPDVLTQINLQSDLRSACDIVIQAIDSSLWKIYSRDDGILQRLKLSFREVKTV